MRALVLSATYTPVIGGAETYARQLVQALQGRGHAVHVITDEPGLGTTSNFQPRSSGITRTSSYRKQLGSAGQIWWEDMFFGLGREVESAAVRFNPDVVITNSLDAALLGAMVAEHLLIPHAAVFHEQSPEDLPLGEGVLRIVYGRLRLDLVVAGSRLYADRALAYGTPQAHLRLIRHGVDVQMFNPSVPGARIRERLGLTNEPLVTSVGRLTPRKGHSDLIAAFAQVAGHRSRPHLLIAGTVSSSDPTHSAALRQQVRELGLATRITFDSDLGLADMPEVYAASQVVAQLSWQEGYGLALLEAMATGAAILATKISATLEIMTVSGRQDFLRLVPAQSPDAAAKALGIFLDNDDERKRLGTRARDVATLHHDARISWNECVGALEQLVDSEGRFDGH